MPSQRALRTFFLLSVWSPLAACTTGVTATPQAPPAAAGSREYAMRPGEQVTLGGDGSLRYVRVANDSRCAPDVQCIWAGDAEVAFAWTPARGARQAFSLHTGREPRQQSLGARRVTLVALARGPAPEATLRVEPAAP